ncbi:MAG TPA: hypothetical protein VK858_16335, partial [Longimicrobiales bacterium]|nr:hypothetical protein [Longimicrobiales bacterium]
MLTSPLASLTGWTWTRTTATDVPKALRRLFPPSAAGTPGPGAAPECEPWAVTGTGPATALRFPATGRWHHAQAETSTVHWIWGSAADLALFPALRTRLPAGNPVLGLRFENPVDAHDDKGEPKGVLRGAPVELGGGAISVTSVTIVGVAPGTPGLDTLGVLRSLRAALAGEAPAGAPTFPDLVDALDALTQPLLILEPGGSPATGRSVALGAGTPVVLDAAHRGDLLTALGIGRSGLGPGATLDVAGGEDVVAVSGGTPAPTGQVPIGPDTISVAVASLAAWLAPQGSPALTRFTRGNTVVPFRDGVTTFADLFRELNRAVTAGPEGVFYVTGYSLRHAADLVPEGADTPFRSVTAVAEAMAAAGGEARFLALQMLQLEPDWVRDVQTTAAIVSMLMAIAGSIATIFQDDRSPDQLSFFIHTQALAAALFVGSASLDSLLEGFEQNRGAIEALDGLSGVEAHLDPVDADVDDNPHATTSSELNALALNAQRRFNVFHQKIQVVRNLDGIHAYCGGIDLNTNRMQDHRHAARSPFHDVHARVNGRAAGELATTFTERWAAHPDTTTPLVLEAPGAFAALPTDGPDVVQVGRTYYGPLPGSPRGHPFAPAGERTIVDTLLQAIGQARRYVYIEDQYLTPPFEFTRALADAAAAVSGPLVIVVPSTPDQPFGLARRQTFIHEMREAWGDRVLVGILRKRFAKTQTTFESAKGRVRLMADLGSADTDDVIELGPPERVPSPPFWLVVDKEVMRAHHKVSGFSSPTSVRLQVDRGGDTNLFKADGGTSP